MKITITIAVRDDLYGTHEKTVDVDQEPFAIFIDPDDDRPDRSIAALSAGPGLEELGRELVQRYGGLTEALRATHPDTGGPAASHRDFTAVVAYKNTVSA